VKAETATYSQDRKTAQLQKITGNIYREGEIVLQISGDVGEIYQDGKQILLKENITAIDPRNKAVIKANEARWRPDIDTLIVKDKLTGSNGNLKISADTGKYYAANEQLELSGNIIALNQAPAIQLKTQHAVWQVAQQQIVIDVPLELARYQDQKSISQAFANRGAILLARNYATLEKEVNFRSLQPRLQVASERINWYYQTDKIASNQVVKIIDLENELVFVGNQGEMDLQREIVQLQGGVRGKSDRNQSQLYADRLTWNIITDIVEAQGNVIYQQQDPRVHFTGAKAVGKLKENKMVVSSQGKQQVITEIYPAKK
ncbi:MAG: LPS export ABC transporter periplasmic protein LptC, partial [Cyanobacteria bacterium J083]